MAEAVGSFSDDQLNAARAFAHTMIVVDDEAGNVPQRSDVEPGSDGAVTPGRGDTRKGVETAKRDASKRVSHPLDQKALVDNALELGLVCAVVTPKKGEGVAKKVANAAKRADIVSLDWQIHDDGQTAQTIIKEIIRRDANKGGRLRLIAIYTGVNDRNRIFRHILKALPAAIKKEHKIRCDEDQIVSANGLRIVWLFKGAGTQLTGALARFQVKEDALAARLQQEFSKLSEGLLSNVALATIAAVRDSTHHTLSKFTEKMDGPYFHHRAFLPVPHDAEDYAVSVVLSELKSAVDRAGVGERWAGSQAISNRINALAPPDGQFQIHYLNDKKKPDSKTGTTNEIIRIISDGFSGETKPNHFPGTEKAREAFTSIFGTDHKSGRIAMMAFASLTGVRSHPGSNLHGVAPRLMLGSVIHSKDMGYLLCLQAACDTVRVKDDDRFFFVRLEENDAKPEHVVPVLNGAGSVSFLGLSAIKGAYTKAVSLHLNPTGQGKDKSVRAVKWGKRYFFKNSDGEKYFWIANLKARRAMRAAQEISRQLTRIGFDEFEPFRLD